MGNKILKNVFSIYFVVIFLLSLFCISVFAVDFINNKEYGEYRIMPILNMQKFKTAEVDEVIHRAIIDLNDYWQHLSDIGYSPSEVPLWKLIDILTMLTTFYNLLLYCVLRFFRVNMPRWITVIMLLSLLISLFQIFAVRIAFHDTYFEAYMGYFYPSAFYLNSGKIPFKVLLFTTLVLGTIKIIQVLPDKEAE